MKILVTGGAGFIGAHLCKKLLLDNYEIVCVDNFATSRQENISDLKTNKGFSFVNYDVIKPLPDSIGPVNAIFHLASPASPNHHSKISYHALPMQTMLVNTLGTLELLKYAKKHSASFLFASSSEVYGDPLVHPQTEDYLGNVSTTGPRAVYDEAKRFGETIVSYFKNHQGVDTRTARIFNTYGPGMLKEDMRMIVSFIVQAKEGMPITIFGDGTQTRALCYVDDTVDGLISLMFEERAKGEVVNIGSPDEHTVLKYAELVKKLTNSKSEIVRSERLPENDPKKRCPDVSKAKRLLSWEPKVPLETGLTKLIESLS